MKVSELRIGNYVSSNDHTIKVQAVAKDNSIDVLDLANLQEFQYSILTQNSENKVVPIPLTEAWFNKLGLYLGDDDFGLRLAIDETNPDQYILGIDKFVISRFKYVHQLQNLYFSITGEELNLKE